MARCKCGSTSVAEGATQCAVCKALHDRDKKKAKAKSRAKLRKGMPCAKKDPVIRAVAAKLRDNVREALEARFGENREKEYTTAPPQDETGRKYAVIRELVHLLCEELPVAESPKVEQEMVVEGKDTMTGVIYNVRPTRNT